MKEGILSLRKPSMPFLALLDLLLILVVLGLVAMAYDKQAAYREHKDLMRTEAQLKAERKELSKTQEELVQVRESLLNADTGLNRMADQQRDFYREIVANHICQSDLPTHDLHALITEPLATATDSTSLGARINELQSILECGRTAWESHLRCAEEVPYVIPESQLRFSVNRWDRFDMPDEEVAAAKTWIQEMVLANWREGRERIIVIGHCDESGRRFENYFLSFKRALHIANWIIAQFDKFHFREGEHYFMHITGMGENRLLPREENEEDAVWKSRCRRIEILFQRVPSAGPRTIGGN